MNMPTHSYIRENGQEIKVSGVYYFGQLWTGVGDGEGLLEYGAVLLDDDFVISFEIFQKDTDLIHTLVRVTSIVLHGVGDLG
ncbi:hypothetical protein [uncultured Robinsoniella sp.]|uniref:hypothetical protein n=1 Tax=uncultured Robinsoniella sp. TaxID=904190 RepID=UPI00374F7C91